MLTNGTTKLSAQVSKESPEFMLAVLILTSRIRSLPKEDRNDLFELMSELTSADDEEANSIRATIMEILIQSPAKVTHIEKSEPTKRLKKWAREFGSQIKKHREQKGWTQTQLATAAGIPQSHLSRLENAEHVPSHKTLEKIAKALGVETRDLDRFEE